MLKIFTSYTPGAGKSYAMMEEAMNESRNGKKVVIAFINKQHRDSSKMPFECNENVTIHPLKGRESIEEIIEMKPDIVVLDELGMRIGKHTFLYNVAESFIKNNISVLTSANLKRFEEVNPIFRSATGVGIKTIIPNRFIKGADEIVFIDREPELMIKDFKEGKLFGERYMNSRIMNKNFEENTLKTYREISLDYLEKYNNVRIIQRD